MPKIKNLTPKFKIPIAEKELELQMGQVAMGSRQGGLSLFSNKFKRGYGNTVFGSDENGIWLGAAEFSNAPFSVDMDGNLIATSATFNQYLTKVGTSQSLTGDIEVGSSNIVIDGANQRIIFYNSGVPELFIGEA